MSKQEGSLCITRRRGQGVHIGHEIGVEVVKVERGAVKLRINAPTELKILRNEVKDRDSHD